MPEFLSIIFAEFKNIAQNGRIRKGLAIKKHLVFISAVFRGFFICRGNFETGRKSICRHNYCQNYC